MNNKQLLINNSIFLLDHYILGHNGYNSIRASIDLWTYLTSHRNRCLRDAVYTMEQPLGVEKQKHSKHHKHSSKKNKKKDHTPNEHKKKHKLKKHHSKTHKRKQSADKTDHSIGNTGNTETKDSSDIVETKEDIHLNKKNDVDGINDTQNKEDFTADSNSKDKVNEEISVGGISDQPSLAIGKDSAEDVSKEISTMSIGTEIEIAKARENAVKPKSRKAILKAKLKTIESIGHEGKYKGDLESGIRHGQGKLKWMGGNSYVGSFKNGLRDGKYTNILHYTKNNVSNLTDNYAQLCTKRPW